MKKIISFILTFFILINIFPISVQAASPEIIFSAGTIKNGKCQVEVIFKNCVGLSSADFTFSSLSFVSQITVKDGKDNEKARNLNNEFSYIFNNSPKYSLNLSGYFTEKLYSTTNWKKLSSTNYPNGEKFSAFILTFKTTKDMNLPVTVNGEFIVSNIKYTINDKLVVLKGATCLHYPYTKTRTVNPTCTKEGCDHCVCSLCGYTTDIKVAALGHNYKTTKTVRPTCSQDGYTIQTCSRCNNKKTITDTGSKLAHTAATAVKENMKNATCTTNGSYSSVVYCKVCKTEMSRKTVSVSALGHNYTSEIVNPTCIQDGYTIQTCSRCGNKKTIIDTNSKLGHTPATAVKENIIESTCIDNGSYDEVVYCERCNEEISRISITTEPLGHDFSNGVCSRCGISENNNSNNNSNKFFTNIFQKLRDFFLKFLKFLR